MRPLETALHGVTLAACAALGAGLWSLSERETPPPPPPSVVRGDLDALSAEIRALRREIEDLRARPVDPEVPGPAAARIDPVRAPEAAVAEALKSPEVEQRLKALVDARLDAERKERDERAQERGREFAEQHRQSFEEKAGLNGAQKELFGKLMEEAAQRTGDVRARVRSKEITRDQGRDELKRYYAELDPRVQGLLTAEQFKQFQEWIRPFRDMALTGGWGNNRGRRSNRENPVP